MRAGSNCVSDKVNMATWTVSPSYTRQILNQSLCSFLEWGWMSPSPGGIPEARECHIGPPNGQNGREQLELLLSACVALGPHKLFPAFEQS